ncbi:MAG TPA: hypothetical protein VED47_08085 [Burkholderiaceae bacterium]|nr:hypothetical protein [Burkholderiaceae bacterium]
MSLKLHRKLSLGGWKSALAFWATRRSSAAAGSGNARAHSPWRPCPGIYGLLVDIHRNH